MRDSRVREKGWLGHVFLELRIPECSSLPTEDAPALNTRQFGHRECYQSLVTNVGFVDAYGKHEAQSTSDTALRQLRKMERCTIATSLLLGVPASTIHPTLSICQPLTPSQSEPPWPEQVHNDVRAANSD